MEAIAGNIVERLAGNADFLFGITAADISCFSQLFLDLCKVFFGGSNVEGGAYGLQIMDIIQGFLDSFGQRFKRSFLLIVSGKETLCIFGWSKVFIQRDGNFFISIVIEGGKRFCPGSKL